MIHVSGTSENVREGSQGEPDKGSDTLTSDHWLIWIGNDASISAGRSVVGSWSCVSVVPCLIFPCQELSFYSSEGCLLKDFSEFEVRLRPRP
jgi:hypothetical protein